MAPNIKRLLLDISMATILVLAMLSNHTNLLMHEMLGVTLPLLLIIHLHWNKFMLGRSTHIRSKSNAKNRRRKIVNLCLIIIFIAIIVSGISQSQVLFPFMNQHHLHGAHIIHHISAYLGLIFATIHLIQHYTFLSNSVRRLIKIAPNNI